MAITPNTPNPVREDAYVEELAEKLGIEPQYIPKSPVWRNEEEIKAIAEMFANMSGGGGSGGGVLVVNMDSATGALDKTWQEISDSGICVISITVQDAAYYMPVTGITTGDGKMGMWSVTAIMVMNGNTAIRTFNASSASDYPVAAA